MGELHELAQMYMMVHYIKDGTSDKSVSMANMDHLSIFLFRCVNDEIPEHMYDLKIRPVFVLEKNGLVIMDWLRLINLCDSWSVFLSFSLSKVAYICMIICHLLYLVELIWKVDLSVGVKCESRS